MSDRQCPALPCVQYVPAYGGQCTPVLPGGHLNSFRLKRRGAVGDQATALSAIGALGRVAGRLDPGAC